MTFSPKALNSGVFRGRGIQHNDKNHLISIVYKAAYGGCGKKANM
jgi:hypothetical protein